MPESKRKGRAPRPTHEKNATLECRELLFQRILEENHKFRMNENDLGGYQRNLQIILDALRVLREVNKI